MNHRSPRILVIGYGNPGRLDDGLGPALADAVERLALPGVTVESNYQLAVEDAEMASAYDVVVFADASIDGKAPFSFESIDADRQNAGGCEGTARYTSHHLRPVDVVDLARRLFSGEPRCYVLAIRGYEFNEFGERLSEGAQANLEKAIAFLDAAIRTRLTAEFASVDEAMRTLTDN